MTEKIIIKNRRGRNLNAIFNKRGKRLVIYSHGFGSDKNYQPIIAAFANRAALEGFSVLRFDYYGSGETGEHSKEATLTSEKEDLQDVLMFAHKEGFSEIAIVAHSLGATITFLADAKPKALALWSPLFDIHWLYERYEDAFGDENPSIMKKKALRDDDMEVGRKLWEEAGNMTIDDQVTRIICPTLIVVGETEKDDIPDINKQYGRMKCEKKLLYAPEGDHNYVNKKAMEFTIKNTMEWLKEKM